MRQLTQQIRAAADLLRPRTFFRALSRVDALAHSTRELASAVERLNIQTEQLLAIQRLDWDRRLDLARLDRILDRDAVRRHVCTRIASTALEMRPFPHLVVESWLPDELYERAIDAVPPPVFFASDRDAHWVVPSGIAPAYSREVWAFIANCVVGDSLREALNRKFAVVVRDYVRSFCDTLPDDVDLDLHISDGRIMLRRPGYDLRPHRDPRWGFITGIAYLAREGDVEAYGTQLYRVEEDREAPSSRVYYIDPSKCEQVKDVPFRANSMVVFLNSQGAHGAAIPKDASAGLERYIYQFRMGPTNKLINRLLRAMPPERAATWANAKTNRAANY